ncbi:hypothetical protein H1R20_g10414, partial [Candolleomyces eurysporus]
MSFNTSRQVVIDDSDPRVQWTGDWFIRDSVGQVGRWSAPFLNTLHGFNGSSASLSFPYYGSGMLVTGGLTPGDRLGSAPATWQCLVDGVVINGSDRVNWSLTLDRLLYLCGPTPLLLKNHTLQLSLSGGAGMVWVDTIEYRVPTAADVGEEWTRVLPSDESILYSDGWEGNDTLIWTYSYGAWLTYDFIGEGVTWSGHIFNDSAVPGLGYYILDGQQPPKSFVIPATGSESLSNYAYINITGLNPGPHRLELRNGGNETTAALGFRSILTQNTLSPSFQPRKGPQTSGKTIGGVVGGALCAVLLLIILAILIRQRRKRRQQPPPAAMNHRGSFRPVFEGRTAATATLSNAEMAQRPPTAPPPPTPGPRPPTAFSQDRISATSPNSEHVPVQYTPGGGAATTNHYPGIGAQTH